MHSRMLRGWVGCSLPRTPENNIVTESLCIAAKDAACAGKGGMSKGAGSSCFPTNPCSPSGATERRSPFHPPLVASTGGGY